MRRIAFTSALVVSWPVASVAQVASASIDVPGWLFPTPAHRDTVVPDRVTLRRVPGSQAVFTEARVTDRFDVADWRPESHPAMPDIVAHGRSPAVYACAYCHLPDGSGRPENAMLAGLSVAYIEQEVAFMKSGARNSAGPAPYAPSDNMRQIAAAATEREIADAARYFSRLAARQRSRVVEATTIPRAEPEVGIYVPAKRGGVERLGRRVIEMPTDPSRHALHDPWVGYVAYVPPGSVARGQVLATVGSMANPPCQSCHGPDLRGDPLDGRVPALAGRSPSYLLRQLVAFRTGARSTPASTPMSLIAESLTLDDMIAAAAYAASLTP